MFVIHEMLMSKSECQASYQCEVLAPRDVASLLETRNSHVIQNRDSMCPRLTDADKMVTRITSDSRDCYAKILSLLLHRVV